jgi:hypothetical protein
MLVFNARNREGNFVIIHVLGMEGKKLLDRNKRQL